jgi:suppressor of G2 allele of SKP1
MRYEWYQTANHVVVTIFVKQIKKEDVVLEAESEHIAVIFPLGPSDTYNLDLDLADSILNNDTELNITTTKIEIRLKKLNQGKMWPSLEKSEETRKILNATHSASTRPTYPSSSKHSQDWNALEKQILKEDQETKPEGEAAVNEFFQKLYANASDDVRRAMNKSFMESQGTCLSTNWEEVAKKAVKPYESSTKEGKID